MLTHDAMLRIARRYDTVMSQAMLRALGYGAEATGGGRHGRGRKPRPTAANAEMERERRRYRALAWCIANHVSPMDGLR